MPTMTQTIPDVICGECGSPMILRTTKKFTYSNGQPRNFFSCSRFPACKGTHGAHPNGQPFGVPADAETKMWRGKAHDAFDAYWKYGRLNRKQSYKLLQKMMRMDEDEAHIGKFDIGQCKYLIACIEGGASDLIMEEILLGPKAS